MKNKLTLSLAALALATTSLAYTPSAEVRQSQEEFAADRFGIFLHWGIYSMFGQGEWYLNYGPKADEYAKAAKGFYPADFDADAWVKAIKGAGRDIYALPRAITMVSRCGIQPRAIIISLMPRLLSAMCSRNWLMHARLMT